jgi:hypothetical protein
VHNCPLLLKVWAPPRHGSPVTHCVKCARGNSLNTIDATKGEVHLSHCRSTGDIHRGFRSGPTTGGKKLQKKEQRAQDGRAAVTEYEAESRATREKTARLKALRLAREAEIVIAL